MFFKKVNISIPKTSDNEYSAEVYLDKLIDEDYYGLGLCEWHIDALTLHIIFTNSFTVSGAGEKTISQEGTAKKYCPKNAILERIKVGACLSETASPVLSARDNYFEIEIVSKRQWHAQRVR